MASTASVIARDDTLFGVCFALAEDFGFNPLYLRLLLALLLFVSPAVAFGAYLAGAVLVGLSRWLVREPRTCAPSDEEAPACQEQRPEELPLAA